MIPLQRVDRPEPKLVTRELPVSPGESRWLLWLLHGVTILLGIGFALLLAAGVLLPITGAILLVLLAIGGVIPVPVGALGVVVVVVAILGAFESDYR